MFCFVFSFFEITQSRDPLCWCTFPCHEKKLLERNWTTAFMLNLFYYWLHWPPNPHKKLKPKQIGATLTRLFTIHHRTLGPSIQLYIRSLIADLPSRPFANFVSLFKKLHNFFRPVGWLVKLVQLWEIAGRSLNYSPRLNMQSANIGLEQNVNMSTNKQQWQHSYTQGANIWLEQNVNLSTNNNDNIPEW